MTVVKKERISAVLKKYLYPQSNCYAKGDTLKKFEEVALPKSKINLS